MLKVRLQGTKNDIRWFLKILSRDKRFDVENTSTFFSNKGTEKYKRLYTEIYRKDKRNNDDKKPQKEESHYRYYGSGSSFF
ncbi:MAG: DUF3970 family protein [Eubacterium sp.]|nr:DUF3970 family protein [Eubacterium sp.]